MNKGHTKQRCGHSPCAQAWIGSGDTSCLVRTSLLAELVLLSRDYQGGPTTTQSRNGDLRDTGYAGPAKWLGLQPDGRYVIDLPSEDDALEFRAKADLLVGEKMVDVEMTPQPRASGRCDLYIRIESTEEPLVSELIGVLSSAVQR